MPSKDIVVGDLLWVRNEEELPADVIVLGGGIVINSGGQPECFV
jgi:magnesium-transporting ATPase (P-type)